MIAFFALRKFEPELPRPFKVPWYPLFPATALIIAVIALISMMIYNFKLSLLYFFMLLGAYLLFVLLIDKRKPVKPESNDEP
jgi:ethanolamine permease